MPNLLTKTVPKVSVIIPTYNRKQWLREAIDSVVRQSYKDLEIIVADDGSTDATHAAVESEFGNAIHFLSLPHRGFPAPGRNAGIQIARGDYVTFLDSDDLWLPNKLALQVKALEEHPSYGWSYGNAVRFGDRLQEESPEIGWRQLHSGDVLERLLHSNFIPCCTVVARKSCFNAVQGFDQTPALRLASLASSTS